MLTFTLAILIISMIIFAIRDGVGSFGFLFLATSFLYLLFIPLLIEGFDTVTGASAVMGDSYFFAVLIYVSFVLLGVRLVTPLGPKVVEKNLFSYRPTGPHLVFKNTFFVLSLFLVFYSITSRNIFDGGELLFTILGFDFLLVYYLITRKERSKYMNLFFFLLLILLFLLAGFRYRIAILVLAEVLVLQKGRGLIFRNLAFVVLTFATVMLLSAFAQFRSYGELNISGFINVEFDPLALVTQSGEQTVSIATIAVVENLSTSELVGLEPFTVTVTHFIPSAIWPNKPRVTYLDTYFDYVNELENTGTAMHDLAQAALMFGVAGLPFSAFLLGLFYGALFRWTIKLSPTRQFAQACIVLFAVFIPTRGYLPQQVTWALTFLLPVVLFHLSSRMVWRKDVTPRKTKCLDPQNL